MRVSDFDYPLPAHLIAQTPAERRDASRLLVLHRKDGRLEHRGFRDLPDYLRPDDCLVLNDTRVFPARLIGHREKWGGRIEIFLLQPVSEEEDGRRAIWKAITRAGWKVQPGVRIFLGSEEAPDAVCDVLEIFPDGIRLVRFTSVRPFREVLQRIGQTPLPPYIRRPLKGGDAERYQTIYARQEGAVAAPTAGLHFTEEVLGLIRAKGMAVVFVTLHVGLGTFKPVKVEEVEEHRIHAEAFSLPEETAKVIQERRKDGGRVVAVGTTVVRVLETCAKEDETVRPASGETDLFIYPGYRFRVVDVLLTNFHLPRSTLLMLVAAFAGRERILDAYSTAMKEGYRFYSYGDAMLII